VVPAKVLLEVPEPGGLADVAMLMPCSIPGSSPWGGRPSAKSSPQQGRGIANGRLDLIQRFCGHSRCGDLGRTGFSGQVPSL